MNRSTSFQPVEDWLRQLGLLHFAQSFYDNGYEDIETCKLIGEEDLDVIGIKSERDRNDIMSAVKRMQQNLYFELEPEPLKKEAERQKIETILLKSKLKDCLHKHNVQLIEPPYYNPDGSLGDLYPLAIRFAEELGTFFNDVLEALEQLRKRQLPVQAYDDITKLPTGNAEEHNKVIDPADYLNCETPINPIRAHSFSKYDTRVTKSTTDLTKDLQDPNRNSQRIAKNRSLKKIDRNKSIFGSVFKKGGKESKRDHRHSDYDFNATDVTLSQNEIVNIFAKVKNNEMSQEDALAAIKRCGLTKTNSGGSKGECSPSSSPEELHDKQTKIRTGKLSKSMIKRTSPSAQFYTKDDDHRRSSSSLQSVDSNSLERTHERSWSLDVDSPPESIKSSPELGKPGLFKIFRNSLRRKGRGDEMGEKAHSPSGSLSSQENVPLNLISEDVPGKPVLEDNTFTDASGLLRPVRTVQPLTPKLAKPAPPPRPTRISSEENFITSHNTSSQEINQEFKERRPSLKIKSYEKYQEEITKRRSQEKNALPVPPPRQTKNLNNNTCTELAHPKPPPRPASRSSVKKSIHTSDMDDIGKDMKELIATLNEDLTTLNENESVVDDSVCRDDVFHKEPVMKGKKPLLPPRSKPFTNSTLPLPSDTSQNNKKIDSDKSCIDTTTSHSEGANVQDVFVKELTKSSMIIEKVSEELEKMGSSKEKQGIKPLVVENNLKVNFNGNSVVKKVSLKQIIVKKLRKEVIRLDETPYTNQNGSWQVPFALIDRYSAELQQPVENVARCFEEVRVHERTKKNLPVIPMTTFESKSTLCKDMLLDDWLVHVGLPMFSEDLKDVEIGTIQELTELSIDSFKNIGVFDEKHVTLLLSKAREFMGYM